MIVIFFACTQDTVSPTNYTLLWQESFDGEANQPLSEEIWELMIGGDGWGNNQLEHNTNRTENVRHNGAGELEIVALREEYEGNAYTSARIRSQKHFDLVSPL